MSEQPLWEVNQIELIEQAREHGIDWIEDVLQDELYFIVDELSAELNRREKQYHTSGGNWILINGQYARAKMRKIKNELKKVRLCIERLEECAIMLRLH